MCRSGPCPAAGGATTRLATYSCSDSCAGAVGTTTGWAYSRSAPSSQCVGDHIYACKSLQVYKATLACNHSLGACCTHLSGELRACCRLALQPPCFCRRARNHSQSSGVCTQAPHLLIWWPTDPRPRPDACLWKAAVCLGRRLWVWWPAVLLQCQVTTEVKAHIRGAADGVAEAALPQTILQYKDMAAHVCRDVFSLLS